MFQSSCNSMKPYKSHSWVRERESPECLLQSTLPELSSVSRGWHCDGVTINNIWNCETNVSEKNQLERPRHSEEPWQTTGRQWIKYSQILMMRICPPPAVPGHPAIVMPCPGPQIMMGQLQDVILCTLIHQQDNIQVPCLTQWVGPWQNTSPSSSTWIQTIAGKITK